MKTLYMNMLKLQIAVATAEWRGQVVTPEMEQALRDAKEKYFKAQREYDAAQLEDVHDDYMDSEEVA